MKRRALGDSVFGFIGRFVGGLWRFANFWRIPPFENPAAGLRVGSPAGGLLMFLVLLFAAIAIVLVVAGWLFGFSATDALGGVDRVLAALGPTLDFMGKVLITKVLMGVVLLICVALVLSYLFPNKGEKPAGWMEKIVVLLLCLMVGFCSAVNVVAPLDPYDPSVGSAYMD
ncbi:MAG: hypothetical protein JSS00_13455 [Proteobacteria bacterium]|nr:hypothetical protein [Pseudomonadota bacterium]